MEFDIERNLNSICSGPVDCEVSLRGAGNSGLVMEIHWVEPICG